MQTATLVGFAVVAVATLIYWVTARDLDSPRDEFFDLAEAFLQGRTWLTFQPGEHDVITIDSRHYLPFGPFPAILFMPLVALIGAQGADELGAEINCILAGATIGLSWVLLGRLGVANLIHRVWVVVLFGFSTVFWWVVVRGGVWHTSQIIATLLTFACLVELWGRQRPPLIGLMAGAAFLTRTPLAVAVPFYMLLIEQLDVPWVARAGRDRLRSILARLPVREWLSLGLATVPAIAFFFWYNDLRFGHPLESGYALADVPDFLAARRDLGLISLAHLGANFELMFLRLPTPIPEYPFIKPDGFGMSVLLTSPGLLLALRAPWRSVPARILAGAALAVLLPNLLYYGGGWVQFGFRYFLDSIPFVIALCGLAVARHGIGWRSIAVILFGVAMGVASVHWADKI
jgi:hypothetical protein